MVTKTIARDLSVTLSGWRLDNPVIPASGTFGFGNEFRDFYDINILGTFSFKGTTRDARFGNPTPRIAECTAGMINAVGLQNPGIDAVIAEELPRLKTFFHKPVIANISGFSVEEYAYCCERIDREPQVGIIEVNVSCPNVRHGGMSFGTSPECAAEVTRAVKAVTTKPVYIKLSPNVTDIVAIARACEEAGADGLCLINTMLGMRIDVQRRKPVIANVMGGFSGDAVFPVALRMVYQVAGACGIPVIGCGGVSSARDVVEMMPRRRSSRRCPAKWSGWASNGSPTSWVVLRGRTPIRRCGNVKRDDDVSGCEASLYDRVASRVHPLAGCRGAAAETERSEGKGRFGGILNTVTSRRTGVRGCMEQERKRKRRDKDVDTRCNHSVRFRQCRGDVRFSG